MKVKPAATIAMNGPIIPPIVSPIAPVCEKSSPNQLREVIKYGSNKIRITKSKKIEIEYQNVLSKVVYFFKNSTLLKLYQLIEINNQFQFQE